MGRDADSLEDMLAAIERIGEFVRESGRDEFMKKPILQDAMIRQLTVLGEAAKRLTPQLRVRDPGIPWRQLFDLRNRLVHVYDHVDLVLVWQIAATELEPLREKLAILHKESASEPDIMP